jgi:hypothetical protein
MTTTTTTYHRPLLGLGLSFLLLVGALMLMEFRIELTGVLFGIAAFSTFIYSLVVWFLNKRANAVISPAWRQKEIGVALLILGGLCLIGTIESYFHSVVFMIIFIELLLLLSVLGYDRFLQNTNTIHGVEGDKKPLFSPWMYWLFLIGNGLVLIIGEDYFTEKDQFGVAFFCYLLFLFFLFTRWFFKQIRFLLNLKTEKNRTELQHLQSQVNPHFFFNILNNLYGLVDKDAKKAQQLILKLSDMMRYSIYDGQKESVSLLEEVDYLKNYLNLHQMRYHKKIDLKFETDIEDDQLQLMPLLFIILVENAFKHGVENLRADAYVHLRLTSTANSISFSVENNFDEEEVSTQPGLGLRNLKRRLELVYPKKHNLSTLKTANTFRSALTIDQL